MNKPRSTLAHFCIALRTARGLTQADLATAAKVHISTLKNVEGDRPVAVATLGIIYRDGLTGKHRLSAEEWHRLLGYWLLREFPGGVSLDALAIGLHAASGTVKSGEASRQAAVMGALGKLSEADAQTLADLARAATGKRGAAIIAAVRALLAL